MMLRKKSYYFFTRTTRQNVCLKLDALIGVRTNRQNCHHPVESQHSLVAVQYNDRCRECEVDKCTEVVLLVVIQCWICTSSSSSSSYRQDRVCVYRYSMIAVDVIGTIPV